MFISFLRKFLIFRDKWRDAPESTILQYMLIPKLENRALIGNIVASTVFEHYKYKYQL